MGPKLLERYFDDVTTTHEAFLRGVGISGKMRCKLLRGKGGGVLELDKHCWRCNTLDIYLDYILN